MWMLLRTVVVAALVGSTASGQAAMDRAELSWRLQALERAWAESGEGSRGEALPEVEAAVQRFFKFDFAGAGLAMDEARGVLRGEAPLAGIVVQAEHRLAWSLASAECGGVAQRPALNFEFSGEAAEGAELEVRWMVGERTVDRQPIPWGSTEPLAFPWEALLELDSTPRRLRGVLIGSSNGVVEERAFEFLWTVCPEVLLKAYRSGLERLGPDEQGFRAASAAVLLGLFDSLQEEVAPEVELPFADWIGDLESWTSPLPLGRSWLSVASSGDHFIGFPGRRRPTPARLFVPGGLTPGQPVPLVIALHGAGGSEHMFFEAYGNGKLVELARARGWIVVSPSHALLVPPDVEGIVRALGEVLPIDADRVAIVGHSMGAAAGVGAVERFPGQVAALVAMGGGRMPKDVEKFAGVPVHVAVGEHDFGRRGGEALHRALDVEGRAAALELNVVPGVEHLMVVQEGLDAAFEFLDAVLEPEPEPEPAGAREG